MATRNDRVGLVIGADASHFTRAMRDVSREADRVKRLLGTGTRRGVFSPVDLEQYEESLGTIQKQIKRLANEYRHITKETKAYRQELDEIEKAGGKITTEQKMRMRDMAAHQRSVKMQLGFAREDLGDISGRRGDIQAGINRGRMRRAGMGVLGLTIAAGAHGIGTALAGLQERQRREASYAQAAGIAGYGTPVSMVGAGMRYGMDPVQAQQLQIQTMLATGRAGRGGAVSNLRMMRGFGLEAGTLTGMQQSFRGAGGNALANELNKSLLQALTKGNVNRVLMGEFANAASSVLGTVAGSRERTTTAGTLGLMGALSRVMGPAYQQAPMRTAKLIGALHGGIRSPQGGEAGEAFGLRAIGFGTDPNMSYWKAISQRSKGATPQNIRAYLRQAKSEYGTGEMGKLAFYRLMGGAVEPYEVDKLWKMQGRELSDANIRKQVGKVPDATREAARGAGRMKYTRKELQRQQARVDLAKEADKALDKWQEAQIKLINAYIESVKVIKKVIDKVNEVTRAQFPTQKQMKKEPEESRRRKSRQILTIKTM